MDGLCVPGDFLKLDSEPWISADGYWSCEVRMQVLRVDKLTLGHDSISPSAERYGTHRLNTHIVAR